MQNASAADAPFARPDLTAAVTRGAARLFADMGLCPLPEFRLPNGRRADIAALDRKGRMVIAEVKSCRADFEVDQKWEDYLEFCDEFFFAVAAEFPQSLLPESEGLIVADAFGGAILRGPQTRPLAAARRKSITLRFARQSAARLAWYHDETGGGWTV